MITRKDVARQAGVSVTIVSRVLNNSGYVAKEKRNAVLKAAQELSYRPNPIALSLQSRKTRQILFYNKDLGNAFNIELYRGMVKYAQTHEYMVALSGSFNPDRIKTMMFDGIILPNEGMAADFAEKSMGYRGIPVVSAIYGEFVKTPKNVPVVLSDASEAMEILIRYLWGKGHKKVAMASPYSIYDNSRTVTFLSMLKPIYGEKLFDYVIESSLCLGNDVPEKVLTEEDFQSEGAQAAQRFVARRMDATAVICFNDSFALGMLGGFHELGVRVPQDVSVAGIDGIVDKYGMHMVPKLTSVSLAPMKQGSECVRILLQMIDGTERPKCKTCIPVQLVEGETVRALPHADRFASIVI